jgi:hypothetical protein
MSNLFPRSLLDCVNEDGDMDLESYMLYSRHEEEEDNEFDEFFDTQPLRQFDLACMGQGNDRDETAGDDLPEGRTVHRGVAELDETGARVVRHLSLDCFRGKLVKHFDILFQRKELQWPSRNGR